MGRRVYTPARVIRPEGHHPYMVVFRLVTGVWLPVAAVTTDGSTTIPYYS